MLQKSLFNSFYLNFKFLYSSVDHIPVNFNISLCCFYIKIFGNYNYVGNVQDILEPSFTEEFSNTSARQPYVARYHLRKRETGEPTESSSAAVHVPVKRRKQGKITCIPEISK